MSDETITVGNENEKSQNQTDEPNDIINEEKRDLSSNKIIIETHLGKDGKTKIIKK